MNERTEAPRGIIRIGTRGSRLALWQANHVADRLRALHPGLTVELVEIKTQGDRDRQSALSAIGGMGLFTKEIQKALIDGSVDVAVHSLKDLPTSGPAGLTLGAIPEREDPADALIAPVHGTLEALPAGSRIGTGSLRRKAQVLHLRPDLQVVELRGNVETRLAAAIEGRLDAVILAEAGLNRLGLDAKVTQRLVPPRFLCAVGQGALGIECRAEDARVVEWLSPLNDEPTRRAVEAERRVLAALEGGCTIPLGAWGRDEVGRFRLDAAVFDPEGRERLAVSLEGTPDESAELADRAAEMLKSQGALRVLANCRPRSGG